MKCFNWRGPIAKVLARWTGGAPAGRDRPMLCRDGYSGLGVCGADALIAYMSRCGDRQVCVPPAGCAFGRQFAGVQGRECTVLPESYSECLARSGMETTRLSSKGQVILPKSVRDARSWPPGVGWLRSAVRRRRAPATTCHPPAAPQSKQGCCKGLRTTFRVLAQLGRVNPHPVFRLTIRRPACSPLQGGPSVQQTFWDRPGTTDEASRRRA